MKEIYLRVIDATIQSAWTEFHEAGAEESTFTNLQALKERWQSRLLAQDFSDDPTLIPRNAPSLSARASSIRAAAANSSTRGATNATNAPVPTAAAVPRDKPEAMLASSSSGSTHGASRAATSQHSQRAQQMLPSASNSLPQQIAVASQAQSRVPGVMPVHAITQPPAPLEPSVYPAEFHHQPSASKQDARRIGKPEPVLPPAPDTSAGNASGMVPQGDAHDDDVANDLVDNSADVEERAAKRPKRSRSDESEDIGAEDLDSSGDSDIGSAGSDPEADNYILAQHDRVRKGPGKWKVQLKEGIAHINGRDYLFNKATCDLDW